MRKISIFLLMSMVLAVLCGCSLASEVNVKKVSPEDENVLHLCLDSDISSPDIQTDDCSAVADYIYSRLVRLEDAGDGSVKVTGDLAESWEVTDGGKSYTFHLREGVLFHNGEELEADDVLFTVDRLLAPESKGRNIEAAEYISGAYDVIYGGSKSVANKGVTVVDKYTVKITLKEAYAPFLSALCGTDWSIYNRDAKPAGAYSTGTGPYRFEEWIAGKSIFLTANDNYFSGRPQIDGVLFTVVPDKKTQLELFTAGKLDIITIEDEELISSYLNDPECRKYVVAEKRLKSYFYCMNESLSPFSSVDVRRGLQAAIDRKTVLAQVCKGQGAVLNGIFPAGLVAYNNSLQRIKYSVQQALSDFETAGYSQGFVITITQTSMSETEQEINSLVAKQLELCGITAIVKTVDEAEFQQSKNSGSIGMYLACASFDINDPDEILSLYFSKTGTARCSVNYYNTAVMDRIAAAAGIADPENRTEEYRTVEEIIVCDDAAVIPMFQFYSYTLVNPRFSKQ